MTRLRLALLSPLPPPTGGIATWSAMLVERLAADPDLDLRHVDLASHAATRQYAPWLRPLRRSVDGVRDLGRTLTALTRFQPDVVHLTTSAGFGSFRDIALLGLARSFGVATVLDYHTSELADRFRSESWLCRPARIAMRLASGIRVLEPGTEAIVRAVAGRALVERIPNMIDHARVDREIEAPHALGGGRRDTIRVVYVGRVVAAKGIAELIDACAATARVDLDLVGPISPAYRRQLELRARARADGAWLTVHGPCAPPDVYRRIRAADIVALPSHAEAFPNVVLEAMTLARPLLATSVGAVPELIEPDGEAPCGVCVAAGDPGALRRGLHWLITHRDRWSAMGAAGRDRVVATYDIDAVVPRLKRFWFDVRERATRSAAGFEH